MILGHWKPIFSSAEQLHAPKAKSKNNAFMDHLGFGGPPPTGQLRTLDDFLTKDYVQRHKRGLLKKVL